MQSKHTAIISIESHGSSNHTFVPHANDMHVAATLDTIRAVFMFLSDMALTLMLCSVRVMINHFLIIVFGSCKFKPTLCHPRRVKEEGPL